MSERDFRLLVHDIADSIKKIRAYTSGMTCETFLEDHKTIDAVVRNLEVIGEASRRLPESLKESHPSVPWRSISGMRNKIVHDYFGLDVELIWEVVARDLKELEIEIAGILKKLR